MSSFLNLVRSFILALTLAAVGLFYGSPVLADAGAFLNSQSNGDLEAAIASTKDPQRLAELQQLQEAVAASDDRAQITNGTTHNLGVFARYKKEPIGSPASFYVLGPGHQTDDDYELVALLVPPEVSLTWGEAEQLDGAPGPRLARILEGEQLEITDPAAALPEAGNGYRLSLPAFTVNNTLDLVAEVPSLSQLDLDQAIETAPLD
jgi:hypothetical protein